MDSNKTKKQGENGNVVLRECSNSTLYATIIGGLGVGTFVAVWISSIISPFLLYLSIRNHQHGLTAVIVMTILAAYVPWKRGMLSKAIANVIDTYHPQYYESSKMVFAQKAIPNETTTKTFYAVHPHGAFCLGWSCLFCSPLMEKVRFCFSPALYFTPFFRLFSRLTGTPGRADKASMISYMKRGDCLALPPGGFEEATLTSLHHDRVYIKKRSGFIKLCLQHGYRVVPVYSFGERQSYWNLQGAWKFRVDVLNRQGFPAILVWGLSWLPLLPKRNLRLMVVAGEPIQLPLIEAPTKQEVKEWHDKYIVALQKLFDEHKEDAYGSEAAKTIKLELW